MVLLPWADLCDRSLTVLFPWLVTVGLSPVGLTLVLRVAVPSIPPGRLVVPVTALVLTVVGPVAIRSLLVRSSTSVVPLVMTRFEPPEGSSSAVCRPLGDPGGFPLSMNGTPFSCHAAATRPKEL